MENYLGEIRIFAGNFAPQDWNFCDGSLLNIADYDALYTLIGTTYGGDGVNTFALPDLRGRIPVGQGNGPGLSSRPLGGTVGEETNTLSTNQMPIHNHAAVATNGAATTTTASPSVLYGNITQQNSAKGIYSLYTSLTPPDVKAVTMNANMIAASGANSPHDNIMLSTTVNFIIALYGIYPSQS